MGGTEPSGAKPADSQRVTLWAAREPDQYVVAECGAYRQDKTPDEYGYEPQRRAQRVRPYG